MGMDISSNLDYLIEVLEREAGESGATLPEKYTSNDIASKVMYITALFNIIYSEEEETGGGSTGGVMVIHATYHYDEEHGVTYYTADKSFEDVASFIENGGIPILIDDYGRVVQCNTIGTDSMIFGSIYMDEDSITRSEFTYYKPDPLNPIQNFILYEEVLYSDSDGGSGGGEHPIG